MVNVRQEREKTQRQWELSQPVGVWEGKPGDSLCPKAVVFFTGINSFLSSDQLVKLFLAARGGLEEKEWTGLLDSLGTLISLQLVRR